MTAAADMGNMLREGDPELFLTKFHGRSDRYAQQFTTAGPDCGRKDCVSGPGHYHPVFKTLNRPAIEDHLLGTADGRHTVGVYTVDAGNKTRLLVWDIDDGSVDTALLVVEALMDMGIRQQQVYLEFSGRKGYHVWLLLQEPMDAAVAFRAARAVVQATGQEGMEAYPKQEELTGSGYGNLIKLPWGVHAANHGWSRTVSEEEAGYRLPDWRGVEWTTEADVHRLARFYREPVRPPVPASLPEDVKERLLPCMHRIVHDGVDKGLRQNAGYSLALWAASRGFTDDEIEALLYRAANQFRGPSWNVDYWVKSLIRAARQRARPGIDCNQPVFHDPSNLLCSQLCPRYRTIPGALATPDAPEGSAHARVQ